MLDVLVRDVVRLRASQIYQRVVDAGIGCILALVDYEL